MVSIVASVLESTGSLRESCILPGFPLPKGQSADSTESPLSWYFSVLLMDTQGLINAVMRLKSAPLFQHQPAADKLNASI